MIKSEEREKRVRRSVAMRLQDTGLQRGWRFARCFAFFQTDIERRFPPSRIAR